MASSHPQIDTCLFHGSANQIKWTNKFDSQTTMEEIHQCVRQEFDGYLQNGFFIQVINPRTKEQIVLNQTVLNSKDSPFKNASSTDDPCVSFGDYVELYIIDYSPDNIETPKQQTRMGLSDKISDNTKKIFFSDALNPSTPSIQFSRSTTETILESRGHEGLLEFDFVFSRIQFF